MRSVAGAGVVVTGAGGGIGGALARRFAAEGARVVVNDLDPASAQRTAADCEAAARAGHGSVEWAGGTRAIAIPGDAASEEGVAELIWRAREWLGEIDLYCANAGVASIGGAEVAEAEWDLSWQVNVMAHVRAARLLLGPWLERGEGHLICTVSAAGVLSMIGSAPYSVTKHAALGFAEWLSLTYRHQGITVQAICPQGVRTAMLEDLNQVGERLLGPSALPPERVADAVLDGIADGRFLILPHPEVAGMYAKRAADPDRWLGGMNKLVRSLTEEPG